MIDALSDEATKGSKQVSSLVKVLAQDHYQVSSPVAADLLLNDGSLAN